MLTPCACCLSSVWAHQVTIPISCRRCVHCSLHTAGQAVWVLYLDVYILNAAGSLQDAAVLAAVAALQDTLLPAVHVTPDGNVERGSAGSSGDGSSDCAPSSGQQQQPGAVPLQLACLPLSLTCGLYKGKLVADPDHEEEDLVSACVSVVVDGQQRLLGARGWLAGCQGRSWVAGEGQGHAGHLWPGLPPRIK